MAKVRVEVEYCGGWGYARRFKELAANITARVPEAEVTGATGRKSSFEIKINGDLAYSKLEAGGFPDMDSVIKGVEATSQGKKHTIEMSTASSCTVL